MKPFPLSGFFAPFPITTSQRTIPFMESAKREERLWAHVVEKYKNPCRIMLEQRYPDWQALADDAVMSAFAKIARNNKTFAIARDEPCVRRILTVLCCHEIIRLAKPQRTKLKEKFSHWWTAFRAGPGRKDRRDLWKEACLLAADTLESPDFENGHGHDWINPSDRDIWLRLVAGKSETEIAADDCRTACSVSRAKKRVVKWILCEAEKTYRDFLR